MRQPLVAGNWKMHGSRAENASLVSGLLDLLQPGKRAEILLCPPFPYLMETGRLLKDSGVALGAQSVCAESQGAFTGEVSAAMLKDVGCRYVLVGHSERRQLFGESDALVARKFVAAQGQGAGAGALRRVKPSRSARATRRPASCPARSRPSWP